MEEFVAKENIRRFEAQLEKCDDEEQRRVLLRLLEAERKRLNKALQGSGSPTRADAGFGSVKPHQPTQSTPPLK